MFDILGRNSEMIGKQYVNFKQTHSNVFGSAAVPRELMLEYSVKRNGMLSWGLTLGKERTVVLLAHVVVLLFSLKRFYMGRFYCDFVNEVEIKWLLNIFWQDFKA